MGRRGSGAVTALVLVCVASLSGCMAGELQFRNDHRLSIQSPRERARVDGAVTIRWRMKGFEPVGLDGTARKDRGAFALFVDRAPMPTGETLEWLARDDEGCKRDPRCPDDRYLADRGVHVTKESIVSLEVLPRVEERSGVERHYVVIVLIDGTGRRIGESAWYRSFTHNRGTVS